MMVLHKLEKNNCKKTFDLYFLVVRILPLDCIFQGCDCYFTVHISSQVTGKKL